MLILTLGCLSVNHLSFLTSANGTGAEVMAHINNIYYIIYYSILHFDASSVMFNTGSCVKDSKLMTYYWYNAVKCTAPFFCWLYFLYSTGMWAFLPTDRTLLYTYILYITSRYSDGQCCSSILPLKCNSS